MRSARTVLIVIAAFGLFGCRADAEPDPKAVAEAARSGAEFRAAARELFEMLLMESCEPAPGQRRDLLRSEQAALRAFEKEARSGPSYRHLDIARADVEHERSSGTLRCWADEDPAFAEIHRRMAREHAQAALQEMQRLAASAAALPDAVAALPAQEAAEFRARVRSTVEGLEPLCPMHATVGSEEILAAARAEVARFRDRVRETPYGVHYAIAEADALFEQRQIVVECAEPPTGDAAEMSRKMLEWTVEEVARMAALARLAGA